MYEKPNTMAPLFENFANKIDRLIKIIALSTTNLYGRPLYLDPCNI